MRNRHTRMAISGGVVAVAAVLAGCGQADTGSDGARTESPATSSASSTTVMSGPPTSGPSTSVPSQAATNSSRATSSEPDDSGQPSQGARCDSGDIDVALGKGDAAAGSSYAPLRFRNTGGTACELAGYPGVSYVAGSDEHQVGPAADRVDAASPTVTLEPGEAAHATVEFVRVRNYPAAACEPTGVTGLRVYLPGETDSTVVSHSGTGCAGNDMSGSQLTVKPVQPGAGGH